jgi:glucose-1-phosphate thymidylyltransferase
MKGIILAGGSGTRLYPITKGISKQLMPIYDKPMIYYPLSVLMLAGIRDILVITTSEDQSGFKRLLSDGSQFGINISYVIQPSPDGLAQAFILGEEFIGDDACAMILGDNIYFGNGFVDMLKNARECAINGKASIFGYQVKDPQRFGIMELDDNRNVIGVEEKPLEPKSDYAITGLYFYPKGVSELAKKVEPSARGELEITSLNDMYLKKGILRAELLGGGFTWFDTGTNDSMMEASNMIQAIQRNNGKIICCPETIAYANGWILKDELVKAGEMMKKNSYGKYLIEVSKKDQKVKKNILF